MPHEEQREKNIQLVTEKALDCFLENGIEKTKIADIARQCGLAERSVFRYFETKADLVLAASLLYWNRVLERIDQMFQEDSPEISTTGLEDAAKILVCYSRLYRLDPKGMRFTLDAELTLHNAGRLHEIKNQPPESFETSNGPMAKAIRKGLADGSIRYSQCQRIGLRQPDASSKSDVRSGLERQIIPYISNPEASGFVYPPYVSSTDIRGAVNNKEKEGQQ